MAKRSSRQRSLGLDGASYQIVKGEVVSMRVIGNDFWGIATIVGPGDEDMTVTGKLLGIEQGSSIEAKGHWDNHPRYGRQFKAVEIKVSVPGSAFGVVSWLASRLPNLGRKRAIELVERFGPSGIWEVIEERPDALCAVDGITPARRDEIVRAYRHYRAERDRMVAFKGYGLSDHQIGLLLKAYGDEAEKVLRENPYVLVAEVRGFGFKRADQLALRMGLAKDSPARIRAGIQCCLQEAGEHGHVYVPKKKLVVLSAKMLEVDDGLVGSELDGMLGDSDTIVEREGRVYEACLDRAEHAVAAKVAEMLLKMTVRS